MDISEKLYTLRKKHGLSQERLAETLGITRQSVSRWELGDSVPDTDRLLLLSDFFGISVDYLLRDAWEQDHYAPAPPEVRSETVLSPAAMRGPQTEEAGADDSCVSDPYRRVRLAVLFFCVLLSGTSLILRFIPQAGMYRNIFLLLSVTAALLELPILREAVSCLRSRL